MATKNRPSSFFSLSFFSSSYFGVFSHLPWGVWFLTGDVSVFTRRNFLIQVYRQDHFSGNVRTTFKYPNPTATFDRNFNFSFGCIQRLQRLVGSRNLKNLKKWCINSGYIWLIIWLLNRKTIRHWSTSTSPSSSSTLSYLSSLLSLIFCFLWKKKEY